MQNFSVQASNTENLEIYEPASRYRLSNHSTFLRVSGILSGIIANDNLCDFHGSGLLPPLALIILRCYLNVGGYQDDGVEKIRNFMHNRCVAESMKQPLDQKGWVWYYVNLIAQYAMNFVKLRLDENGQSVPFGQRIVVIQLFCIQFIDLNAARVWFRHALTDCPKGYSTKDPPDGDPMISMDLWATELPEFEYRVALFNQLPWEEGRGMQKPLMWRSTYDKKGKCLKTRTSAIPYQFTAC